MTASRLRQLEKARERAGRALTWEPGSVPRHVSEAVADAFFDRHVLLDELDRLTRIEEAALAVDAGFDFHPVEAWLMTDNRVRALASLREALASRKV